MSKKIQIQNLTAKAASLFLAVVVWFLIKFPLQNQPQVDQPSVGPEIDLGPFINPDLQEKPAESVKETPTVH